MSKKENGLTRRDFIKSVGVTGLTSMLALSTGLPEKVFGEAAKKVQKAAPTMVPTKIFGKTKIPVSILSLGGIFPINLNQIMLKKSLDWGVTYWDTADCYEGGNSEIGIGMYFEKFPDARKKVFLVTKSCNHSPAGMTELLNRSLERMKTDYIDLYFLHALRNPDELTPEVKQWAENAKKEKKIKYFGFSAHQNMAESLMAASKLGWIDGIMMTYNFRMINDAAMKAAIDACYKAGIGLTAMKTQGGGQVTTDSEAEIALAGKFLQKGYTPEQAKIKAIWGDERIVSICSQMSNLTVLSANYAAAIDKTKLAASDYNTLNTYAEATCSGYCAGCSDICESAMNEECGIAEVMRYMMYHTSYGDTMRARTLFAELPANVRSGIAALDYSAAERACPRHIEISKIMKQAAELLG